MSLRQVAETSIPRLAPGVRLKLDTVRNCWVVLAPERVLIPEETALEILRRCDGQMSLSLIIDALAMEYDAPHDVIAEDVHRLIGELTDKGILRL
jgi:pyrroloquinoline quinone biosynthesis protein D